MMTVEEAKKILTYLFNREMKEYWEDKSLGCDELIALQVMADHIRNLEETSKWQKADSIG